MEAKLKQEKWTQYSCVYTNTVSREETAESVVPDVMPDIAKILDTDSVLFLRAKNTQNGKVIVDANIQSIILYLAEDSNEIYKIEVVKPVSFVFENEFIREQDLSCVYLKINHADTRILNPRKILLRSDVQAELKVYRQEEISVAVNNEETEGLQLLKGSCEPKTIQRIYEKPFSVSEEFSLASAHYGEIDILSAKAIAAIEETKQVGEKMILQGSTTLRLLYKTKDGGFPKVEILTSTFSQILDCVENAEGPHTLWLTPTSVHFETINNGHGGVILLMDLNLIAQMVCRKNIHMNYIQDAYTLSGTESVHRESMKMDISGDSISLRETIRDMLETTDTVNEILDYNIQPGIPTIGSRNVKFPINIQVIYSTVDGCIGSVANRIMADIGCDDIKNKEVHSYPVKCMDAYFAPATGGIELRIPIEIKMDIIEAESISVIKSIEFDKENPVSEYDAPSLTVVRCPSTDLWTIAKKYKTTCDLIEAANKNMVNPGDLLLIPRPR